MALLRSTQCDQVKSRVPFLPQTFSSLPFLETDFTVFFSPSERQLELREKCEPLLDYIPISLLRLFSAKLPGENTVNLSRFSLFFDDRQFSDDWIRNHLPLLTAGFMLTATPPIPSPNFTIFIKMLASLPEVFWIIWFFNKNLTYQF